MLVAAVLLSSSLGVSYAKTDEICQQAETENEKQSESQKAVSYTHLAVYKRQRHSRV